MDHVEYFFGNISTVYDKEHEFEIYLHDGRWEIKDTKTEWVFGTTEYKDALAHLIKMNVDMNEAHVMFYNIVCTEGVLKRMQLRKIEDMVGKDAVDRQSAGWDSFGEQLKKELQKEIKKPKLSMVE